MLHHSVNDGNFFSGFFGKWGHKDSSLSVLNLKNFNNFYKL